MRIKYLKEESRFVIKNDLGFYIKEGPKRLGLTTKIENATRYFSSTEAYDAARQFEGGLIGPEGRSPHREDASTIVAVIALAGIAVLGLVVVVMSYMTR